MLFCLRICLYKSATQMSKTIWQLIASVKKMSQHNLLIKSQFLVFFFLHEVYVVANIISISIALKTNRLNWYWSFHQLLVRQHLHLLLWIAKRFPVSLTYLNLQEKPIKYMYIGNVWAYNQRKCCGLLTLINLVLGESLQKWVTLGLVLNEFEIREALWLHHYSDHSSYCAHVISQAKHTKVKI